MFPRGIGLVCLACLGCHALLSTPSEPADSAPNGARCWSQGQATLCAGDTEQAIALYRQSLALQPNLQQNHLSLAAALLAKGDEVQACDHLRQFLAAQPDHRNARFFY